VSRADAAFAAGQWDKAEMDYRKVLPALYRAIELLKELLKEAAAKRITRRVYHQLKQYTECKETLQHA
jgi:tetratricopeptide (TPR) repeat protein